MKNGAWLWAMELGSAETRLWKVHSGACMRPQRGPSRGRGGPQVAPGTPGLGLVPTRKQVTEAPPQLPPHWPLAVFDFLTSW